uniref:RNA (guanine-9-)-methyltransferase domain-containing protein 1 n=1 Tax=Rhodnius prolixus TaxID=13249 RepID=T1HKU4_RHOPR
MLRYLKTIRTLMRHTQIPKQSEFNKICVNRALSAYEQKHFCSTKSENDNIYSNVDYEAITKGDSELLQKLKVLMLEMEVLRQEGGRVPENMSTERWCEILHTKSKSQRIKQLGFWWINEKKKERDKEKRELKRLAREESKKHFTKDSGHIFYGFGGSTIFQRMYDTTMDRWKNWKLMEAMMFSQSLVIDCGYEDCMNNAELSNCAKQLLILFAQNRSHREPFNLYFCNASRDNKLIMKLEKSLPTMHNPDFPMNITEKTYTEIFPREKLVYLTPHCREELKVYSEDDIYIIGM